MQANGFWKIRHLLLSGLLLQCHGAFATDLSAPATFTEGAITLDGKMDEAAWTKAGVLGVFTPFEPTVDVEPRFKANGKVLSTKDALYFFIRVEVPKEKLLAPLAPRDKGDRGDRVNIQIDPYRDGRRAFSFEVTPAGVLTDGLMRADEEANTKDTAWNSLFDAVTSVQSDHWTAEVRIPFQSLRFDAGETAFNAHVFAYAWKDQQALSWAPINRDESTWIPQMGEIHGLVNPEPGRALEFIPSFTAGWKESKDQPAGCNWSPGYGGNFEACGVQGTVSASAKWAINPSTSLDLAFNPDFSQVEADARQLRVNNRFALQLEERRPFFLEGIDLFQVSFLSLAQLNRRLEMVYTRAINQPLMAAKITGQSGASRYGAFVAYDQTPAESVNSSGFSPSSRPGLPNIHALTSLARGVFDVGSKASIGVLVMDKEFLDGANFGGGSEASNQVLGLDGQVYLTPQLSVESALLLSHAKDLFDETRLGMAGRARILYRQDLFRLQSHYETLSPGFRSEAGYIPRTGFHNFFNKMDFFYRSESDWARVLSPGAYASVFLDERGELSERIVGMNNYWKFGHQVSFFPVFERVAERVDDRWLDTTQANISLAWRGLQWMELSSNVRLGDTVIREELREGGPAYIGWQFQPSLTLTLRPTDRLSFVASHFRGLIYAHYNGPLLADEPISRLLSQYFFTRNLTLRAIAEWDALTDDVSGDLLFSYQPSPATLIFLGYREEFAVDAYAESVNRSIFAKFSYLFSI